MLNALVDHGCARCYGLTRDHVDHPTGVMTPARWPAATRDDHQRFCDQEGWERTKTARGQRSTHHVTDELVLPNGDRLRTRISRPVDRTDYGPGLWSHTLREQLVVTEEEFWICVRDGIRPARDHPDSPPDALPTELAHLLIHVVHLPDAEVRAMSKDQAVERLNQYWTEGT